MDPPKAENISLVSEFTPTPIGGHGYELIGVGVQFAHADRLVNNRRYNLASLSAQQVMRSLKEV